MTDAATETTTDLYALLGVHKDASALAIRQAYRAKAAIYHPDVQETGSAAKFREIQMARDVLTRADWRANYDALGVIPADEADNAIAAMLTALAGMFGQCMHSILSAGHEPCRGDFLAAMQQAIKTGFENANKSITTLTASREHVANMQGRFKVKSFDHPNHLESIVADQLKGLDRQIDGHRGTLRQLETARLYLNDVAFEKMSA